MNRFPGHYQHWLPLMLLIELGVFSQNLNATSSYANDIRRARNEAKEHHFNAAWNAANAAIQLNGHRWEAYFLRGIADIGLQKPANAITDFRKASQFAP